MKVPLGFYLVDITSGVKEASPGSEERFSEEIDNDGSSEDLHTVIHED
jgi:hypothetical protein